MNPVIITTEERFVLFGYLEAERYESLLRDDDGAAFTGRIVLYRARMVIRWSGQPSGARGLPALAACGPEGAAISPTVPAVTIPASRVTTVWRVTDDAARCWSAA